MAGGRVCLGQIGAAHGVRGEVRLRSFTSDPPAIASYGPLETDDGRSFQIETLRPAKDHFVAKLAGVADRNAAERLTNLKLYVPRERLPALTEPNEFYHADLIGLSAVDTDGNRLGIVVAIYNFGAGDLLELKPDDDGTTELVPFDTATVPAIDIAAGKIVVNLPDAAAQTSPPLRGRSSAKRSGGG